MSSVLHKSLNALEASCETLHTKLHMLHDVAQEIQIEIQVLQENTET